MTLTLSPISQLTICIEFEQASRFICGPFCRASSQRRRSYEKNSTDKKTRGGAFSSSLQKDTRRRTVGGWWMVGGYILKVKGAAWRSRPLLPSSRSPPPFSSHPPCRLFDFIFLFFTPSISSSFSVFLLIQ